MILLGDCIEMLRDLDDDSVDAIVTDPPYGLGFMGKAWDDLPPGVEFAEQALRVLKPGGHMLAFGGTRTWHRLAVAVEDAGFELRDSIAWLYGCHDDQTEVLTRRGWINGLELTDDDDVAQWAPDGTVSLVRPHARQRYPYEGRLVRFRNADIDQLVTPNHRVYYQTSERKQVNGKRAAAWSAWQVNEAADVNRWQRMRFPASGQHDGPGIGGTDYAALLGWMWAEGGFDLSGTGVRIYQSSVNQPFVDEIAALLDRLGPHKRYDYARNYTRRNGEAHPHIATTWYISGDLATRVRADLPGKAPTWDLLWRMTSNEKRALWDAAMKGDGSKASRTFWQKNRESLEWAQALLTGIGCRGKIATDSRGALHWTDRPTVELQRRHLVDDGENYTGEVWCVTVPSGAFIVRRNGKVSVSGNSGFPKSMDVSKAIDKAAGAKREKLPNPRAKQQTASIKTTDYGDYQAVAEISPIPATPEAERWQGWGTALKPGHEPIVVARKPLAGTVAANVLEHGTGALNIDGCRIETDDHLGRPQGTMPQPMDWGNRSGEITFTTEGSPLGRWPANVILDESQAAVLDEQSGELTSGKGPIRTREMTSKGYKGGGLGQRKAEDHDFTGELSPNYGDSGGASRFFYCAKAPKKERPEVNGVRHPTVKPLTLMRWLVRLVTPPGGVVLDPFAGSGTTLEAAREEGFDYIGIERELDYARLIDKRLGLFGEFADPMDRYEDELI